MILAWIRLGIAAALILSGIAALIIALVGVFRFEFVLNRMHAAAVCDTLGAFLILLGLMLLSDSGPALWLKLILIIVFIWLSNPVSSHLICHVETETCDTLEEELEVIHRERS